ncbi:MAG: class I SAM-dependent methyltransferase [Anaerolineales bacterium]
MDDSFPCYLLAKQSVDDRALNKDVLSALRAALPERPLTIIEVGGGIGTMLARLLRWQVIAQAEYTLVDAMPENIAFAQKWLPQWAQENGLTAEVIDEAALRLFDARRLVRLRLVQADVFDFIARRPPPADLLIAHAFLDLLPMPQSLAPLLSLTGNLAWLTLNFDGVTSLAPCLDPDLDAVIERLYHETMDSRPGGGDSLSGRHLFGYLEQAGAWIEAAGASDWVVYPRAGQYPAEEAYFLQVILHFFEAALGNHAGLDKAAFANWLEKRRGQVRRGELVYIAHQMDFLARVCGQRKATFLV